MTEQLLPYITGPIQLVGAVILVLAWLIPQLHRPRDLPHRRVLVLGLIGLGVLVVLGGIGLEVNRSHPTSEFSGRPAVGVDLHGEPENPNIQGSWFSNGNGLVMPITQEKDKIESSFDSRGGIIKHNLDGRYDKTAHVFTYQVRRTDNATPPCTVVFHGQLKVVNSVEMHSQVQSTSGECGFDPSWQETLIWTKRPL